MSILTTIEAMKNFAGKTQCFECKREIEELIEILDNPDIKTVKIHFDTDCEH